MHCFYCIFNSLVQESLHYPECGVWNVEFGVKMPLTDGYSPKYYVVLRRYVQILRCAQDDTMRNVVILSAAKDLYASNTINIRSFVVEN